VYKDALDAAQIAKERLWSKYDRKKGATTSKKKFTARIIEVHSGDQLSVKEINSNETQRIFLASIRAPRKGNPHREIPPEAHGIEA